MDWNEFALRYPDKVQISKTRRKNATFFYSNKKLYKYPKNSFTQQSYSVSCDEAANKLDERSRPGDAALYMYLYKYCYIFLFFPSTPVASHCVYGLLYETLNESTNFASEVTAKSHP
uniref:Uncharacterized protein n=1 Tax=Glossina austeni TaxID=7395 RepID=A0A1A9UT37_GLOAU